MRPGILISTGSSIVVIFTLGAFNLCTTLYNVVVFPSPVGAAIIVILFLLSKLSFINFSSLGKPNSSNSCTSAFFFSNLNTNFSPNMFFCDDTRML